MTKSPAVTVDSKGRKRVGGKWAPGHSGNPAGGIPKVRALARILLRRSQTEVNYKGKTISGKDLIAELLWQAATIGKIVFPDERELKINFTDWFSIVRFIYQHTDGPPRRVSSSQAAAVININYVNDWRSRSPSAPPTRGSTYGEEADPPL